MATASNDLGLGTPMRSRVAPIPMVQDGPRGPGQGPLRELLGLISRNSESYAWRWDDAEWQFAATDKAMFDGAPEALHPFGLGRNHVVDETDSPVRFLVSHRGEKDRVLELSWDSVEYDLKSMPPHVRKWSGPVRAAALVGGVVASWGAVIGVLAAFGAFG